MDRETRKPESEYIKLKSCDSHEFFITRKAAYGSTTIRNMLSGPGLFTESEENEIHFRELRGVILEKVCEYLNYKDKYLNALDIPEFEVDPELALELLMAADYLDT